MIQKILFIAVFSICISLFIGNEKVFAVSAEENYKFYCTQCHGMEGKGDGANSNPKKVGIELPEMSVTPRNHTNPVDMEKLSDIDVENAIISGGGAVSKSTIMPPFGKTLTEAEVKDLVAYLRKLCKCKGK